MRLHAPAIAFALALLLAAPAAAGEQPIAQNVRSTDSRVLELLDRGYRHSTTFRQIVDRLEGSDVIIYVEFSMRPRPPVNSYLAFAAATEKCRYLRILIRPNASTGTLIALLGHELQHAVEVATSPSVRDEQGLAALYGSIGNDNEEGWDSREADGIASVVEKELGDAMRAAPSGPADEPHSPFVILRSAKTS